MNPLAHLLLAACALHAACALAIPEQSNKIPDLSPEVKDPLEKAPELIDHTSAAQDVENPVHDKPEDIPVEVVVDEKQPSIKTNEVADDEDVNRPSPDLRNPGPPQRQEHETQNADHFSDELEKVMSVRDSIIQTQDLFRQGFKGVTDDIQNWLSNNEQVNAIQQNIQSLQETFTAQIQKLNETIQGLARPQLSKPEETPEQIQVKKNYKQVENRLKILESNFNNGVRALSEGVNYVASLKADGEAAAAQPGEPAPAPPAASSPPSTNPFISFMSGIQHTVADSMRNVTQALNNMISNAPVLGNFLNPTASNTPANGTLADTPEDTTQRPFPWQNWQLPSFPNLIQNPFQNLTLGQGQTSGTGPIQTISNNLSIYLSSLFSAPAKPNQEAPSAEAPSAGNSVPEKPADTPAAESVAMAPAPVPTPAPAQAAASAPAPAPIGPIRQILNNNPVVQGITGAVNRIQNSINNPEKPRETEKNENAATKGGFYGRPPGDNIDIIGLKKEEIKEDAISEQISKEPEAIVKEEKEDTSPEAVLEKTE